MRQNYDLTTAPHDATPHNLNAEQLAAVTLPNCCARIIATRDCFRASDFSRSPSLGNRLAVKSIVTIGMAGFRTRIIENRDSA